MYRISELAQKVGLSRSTLLYYEKLGLISAQRQANGYRSYSAQDLQRLKLLQQLQAGGLTDSPDEEALKFWQQNYPQMETVERRCDMMEKAGYQVIESFELSQQAWENYLNPLRAKVSQLAQEAFSSKALDDLQKELNIHQKYLGQYGYQVFVLQNKGEK